LKWQWSFLRAGKIGGPAAALLSTLIVTTTPAILGHAGLATTNTALAAFTGAAALCTVWWAEKPDIRRSIFLGLTVGLAVMSKFSALAFLPAAWLLMYLWHFYCTRRADLAYITRLIPAILTAAALIALIPDLTGGLRSIREHNQIGHLAYLLGQRSGPGFWHYYPVVTGVKTPLATLILVLVAIRRSHRDLAMPLALGAGILCVAIPTHINIGIRHILPLCLVMAICAGVAAARLWPVNRLAVFALVCWHIISTASVHPDNLAYTNELAGSHPERILADSDPDWDQSMGRLATRLRGGSHFRHLQDE
jgi:hypothetical protein